MIRDGSARGSDKTPTKPDCHTVVSAGSPGTHKNHERARLMNG